jgi:hypothetical protein
VVLLQQAKINIRDSTLSLFRMACNKNTILLIDGEEAGAWLIAKRGLSKG